MRNEIKLLDAVTVDQIAAGEVVERPASVVKELVENAIDAKASAVTVEIKEGGIQLIRVTDDGNGIPSDQVGLAFSRHSTSKIRCIEDLKTIASLGFRGEALSSIASVSRVELLTKTAQEITGSRYVIEGGEELSFSEAGLPDGTTFFVRNLFYNTPARRKFLKTASGEAGQVQELMVKFALSHPELAFTYIQNGQTKFVTSGNGKLQEVIYELLGKEWAKAVIPVSFSCDAFRVEGFIGEPRISRGNRNYEYYFVNGRSVKSRVLAGAIEDGYQGQLMQHRYPFVVLLLSVPGDEIDVNVHPSKMEVRFHKKEQIYRELSGYIQELLNSRQTLQEETFASPALEKNTNAEKEIKPVRAAEPFEKMRRKEELEKRIAQKSERPKESAEHSNSFQELFTKLRPAAEPDASAEQMTLSETTLFSEPEQISVRMVGQVFGTYWIVEYEEQMLLIDQHAAHEKVLYEQMMLDLQTKTIYSQQLSPPAVVTLSPVEAQKLESYREYLGQMGYEISHFGGNEYAVHAVPSNLYGLADKELLLDLLEGLEEDTGRKNEQRIYDRIATMSCKAAVKGNHRFSEKEAAYLFEELLRLKDPYHCPHGRPTMIVMSKAELEKKFRRIV